VQIFLILRILDTRPTSSKDEVLTIKPNIMITYCFTAFPLTPNTVTLNDFEE